MAKEKTLYEEIRHDENLRRMVKGLLADAWKMGKNPRKIAGEIHINSLHLLRYNDYSYKTWLQIGHEKGYIYAKDIRKVLRYFGYDIVHTVIEYTKEENIQSPGNQ